MVIVMEHTATEEQVQKVIETLVEVGYDVHRSTGVNFTVLGAVGVPRRPLDPQQLELRPGRARGREDLRALQARGPHVQGRGHGGGRVGRARGRPRGHRHGRPLLGGERASRCEIVAQSVAASGARMLRGGAFKPRTSPYSFQGHGEEALRWMREAAADAHGLAVISEVMDLRAIEMMMRYVDCLQVGARNMQNFDLLKELGQGAQARAPEARPLSRPSRSGCSPPSTSWRAATAR